MLTERLKSLANQYLKDYWQLSKEEQNEVTSKFFFCETQYCNACEIDVIFRGLGYVGKSYDYNDIEWIEKNYD